MDSKKESKYSSIHYNSYLALDTLLDAQHPRSKALGHEAHDEMLFIVTHQVYELWFKQIIHELNSIVMMFDQNQVNERSIGITVSRLDRILSIFDLLIDQIAVLETMTPLDFLDFRNYLFPASGFQSFQFRTLEVMLGLKNESRHTYNNAHYAVVFDDQKKEILHKLETSRSLSELIQDWLERMPFLEFEDFNFISYYKQAVANMLDREKKAIQETDILSDEYKAMRLRMLGDTDTYFANIWDESKHQELMAAGSVKFSYKATVAMLFINLYRDEPILHLPYQLLSRLVSLDEALTTWRYRHAQMVLRMLGRKIGTGGSSGHEYLNKTAEKHHIFADLHNVSTLLIPRSELPALPEQLHKNLSFYFTEK